MFDIKTVPTSFPQLCFQKCTVDFGQDEGTIFGLSKGELCLCQGQNLSQGIFLNQNESSECTTDCGGDAGIKCGGWNKISVYSVERVETRPYERRGCRNPGQLLLHPSLTSDDMTPQVGIVKWLGWIACFAKAYLHILHTHTLALSFLYRLGMLGAGSCSK